MSEETGTELAAAAQSLRDTAKWLVGGVVATAAGVFAGSSLTSFGSLDPIADCIRFWVAAGGLVVGFIALAFIMRRAIKVLTRRTFTFRELAKGTNAELVEVRDTLLERHKVRLPQGVTTLQGYVDHVKGKEREKPKPSDLDDITKKFAADSDAISEDVSFYLVRLSFDRLVRTLSLATPFALLGFGAFAWAANPPAPKSAQPAFSFTIQGPAWP